MAKMYEEGDGQMTFIKSQANRKEKKRYRYFGTPYIKDQRSFDREIFTTAPSMLAAIRNIKYWIAQAEGCKVGDVFIDISLVKEVQRTNTE